MYLKGESLYMSYSFFSIPFTGATTVSAEEEILEGEEVVISSLSFVNARTPEVLLKVLLDNRCFKFLLLSTSTNLNDATRDMSPAAQSIPAATFALSSSSFVESFIDPFASSIMC